MNNILFIDDENDILESYKTIMTKKEEKNINSFFDDDLDLDPEPTTDSYNVLTALQGEEGLDLLEARLNTDNPVKVAFIDMRMPPGINGVETAKRIRELDERVEIVIVTAFSDISLNDIVQQIGSPDKLLYLKKPFDSQEISQFAHNLCIKYDMERIKDEFISNVSHELKTPLSSIIGFQQLLEETIPPNSEASQFIYHLGYSAKMMRTLVEELLLTLEFKDKGVNISPVKTDIVSFVKEQYECFKPLFTEKNSIDFQLEIDTLEPNISLQLDQLRIAQCLNNLISNSLKFTDSGFIKISLIENEDFIKLAVADSGCGISNEKIENVASGLGLGLSIIDRISKAHNFEFVTTSELKKGTTISLVFSKEEQDQKNSVSLLSSTG